MPIPKPKQNEPKPKFLGRCIAFEVKRGMKQNQATAICYEQWRKHGKG